MLQDENQTMQERFNLVVLLRLQLVVIQRLRSDSRATSRYCKLRRDKIQMRGILTTQAYRLEFAHSII